MTPGMSTHNNKTQLQKAGTGSALLLYSIDLQKVLQPVAAGTMSADLYAGDNETDNNTLRKSNELLISSITN